MKNRILRSALSVALCAAMLLSQGLTAFAEGEIDLAAAKSSPVQESSEESEAKTPTETLTPETKKELPASTEDETKTETTTGQPTAEDDTAKEITPIKPVNDEIAKRLEVTVICDNPFHTSQDATYTFYNDRYFTVSEVVGNEKEGAFFTVEINPQQYFDVYEKLCGTLYGEHHLVTKKVDPITFTWNNKEKTWDIKDAEVPVEIHVICEAELPSIDPSVQGSILEKIWVDMNCTEDDKHDTLKYTNLASVSPLDYSIEYNKDEDTATVSLLNLDEWVRLYEVQDKVKHTFTVSNPSTIGLKYNPENGWQLEDESKNTFVIEIACDAVPSITPDEIVDVLGNATVNVVCTTDGNRIPFEITAESIRVGEWDDTDNSVPFYLSTESYVDEFNLTYPGHALKNSDNKEIELWIFYGEAGWTVNFSSLDVEVVCSGTPVEPTDTPEPPSMEEIMTLLWDKKVTANCTNADCKKKETYDIQYESIGGLLNPTIKPIEGEDGSYSLKLTIAYEPYKDDFEDKYGPHNFADNQTSTSEFYLKWDGIKWSLKDPDFFPGSFNIICDTPSTGSLWGWNNGKEVIITCVEENALHTKGLTLPLTGITNSQEQENYWKFAPITWDQEQKCYTTTVTLEPGKYLEVYSGQYGEHALVSDHEDTVLSLKLSYQDGNGKWISNGDKFYLFVECNAPSKPTIEDLDRLFTNNTKVSISCKKNKHADKWYPVKDNSVDRLGYLFIGPVEVDDNNHYTAKISLNDAFFINLYNQEEGVDHSLVSKTYITLSYDGEKWVFNDESKLDFDVVVTCPDNDNPGGGEDPGTNPGGGDNGNNGGNNNGGSTGGGSSVSRRDDDDDWEPLPNNNYRVTKKNDKPSQNTQIVVRDPADNSDNTSSNTGSDSGKHNPETGDTTTAFAAMALAAVSLGGVVLLGRKKK